jgi:hypothetical protein
MATTCHVDLTYNPAQSSVLSLEAEEAVLLLFERAVNTLPFGRSTKLFRALFGAVLAIAKETVVDNHTALN